MRLPRSVSRSITHRGAGKVRQPRYTVAVALYAVALSWSSGASAQPVVYVDATATGTGSGLNWTDAKTNLQDALALADGATFTQIWMAAGTYYPDVGSGITNNDRTVSFTLKPNVEIYGGFDKTEVVPADRVLSCYGATGFTSSCAVPTDCALGEVCVPDVVTILSGDLQQNDGPDFANYGDNSLHVLTAIATIGPSSLLDGLHIRGGNANGSFPDDRGGALLANDGDPSISQCIFDGNRSAAAGGAFQGLTAASPQFVSCLFQDNESGTWAGAYASDNSLATLDYCVFRNNSALNGNGGAMDNFQSGVVIQDSVFESNTALHDGGAVMNFGAGTPEFHRCTFRDNQGREGGAVFAYQCSPQIIDSVFEENVANLDGGAAFIAECPSATFIGLTLNENTANDDGGALRFVNGTGTVSGSTFTNNIAEAADGGGGGAVFNFQATTSFSDCKFYNNTAGDWGGAFLEEGNGALTISDCEFANNSANNGGAIWAAQGFGDPPVTPIKVRNSTFLANTATFGGAANLTNSYNSEWVNVTFIGNTAENDGGAANMFSAAATFTNCSFYANIAKGIGTIGIPPFGGGAIFVQSPGGEVFVNNSTLANNKSLGTHPGDNGGGIMGASADAIVVNNSILWGNTAVGAATVEEAQIAYDTISLIWVQYSIIEGLDVYGGNPLDENLGLDPEFRDLSSGDLTLASSSPAISNGSAALLPADSTDIDDDLNTGEPLPLDLNRLQRVDGTLDIGAFEYYVDCDYNGLADACDVSCIALGGTCGLHDLCATADDCDGNGRPDSCDLLDCGGLAACSDCQPNGVQDACDIAGGEPDVSPIDGIPDVCTFSAATTTVWTNPALWPLGGQYPDNADSAVDRYPTVSAGADVDLDESVVINGLTVEGTARLNVTKSSGVPGDGDMLIANDGNVAVRGTITVANDRIVDVSVGEFNVQAGGTYLADAGGGDTGCTCGPGEICAGLLADAVKVVGGECGSFTSGGQILLTDAMSLDVLGDLLLQGPSSPLCEGGSLGTVAGVTRPPNLTILDTSYASIYGDFILEDAVKVTLISNLQAGEISSGGCVGGILNLAGNFVNKATYPSLIDLLSGTVNLIGSTPQRFEAASLDLGPVAGSFLTDEDTIFETSPHTNFTIGNLNVTTGADVRFVNEYVNSAGPGACAETVYVDNLTLESGSTVRLDNVRVQYRTLIDNGATIEPIGCGALVAACSASEPLTEGPIQNRFLTVAGNDAGVRTALRVTAIDLPAPFDTLNGVQAWVGPPTVYCENASQDTPPPGGCADTPGFDPTFSLSTLQCDPFYEDWPALGVVSVAGSIIIPGGTYHVQAVSELCNASVEDAFSAPLVITNGEWGDILGSCATLPCTPPDGSVDVTSDVVGILDKFSNAETAPAKTRADLEPAIVDLIINITDVTFALDAFTGADYPFAPPGPPCVD